MSATSYNPHEQFEHVSKTELAQLRIAEQARQLDAARDTMIAVMPHLPISGDGYNTRHPARISIDVWLAANPAPQEPQP